MHRYSSLLFYHSRFLERRSTSFEVEGYCEPEQDIFPCRDFLTALFFIFLLFKMHSRLEKVLFWD